MSTDTSHPSIVIDMQELVTHADSAAIMEHDMGKPPRVIRGQDVCYLFHARDQRDQEVLPGFVDRWQALGITAQVVVIQPTSGQESRGLMPR